MSPGERVAPLAWAGLALWAAYLLAGWACARASLGAMELPGWARPLQAWTWPVRWRMFTDLRDQHDTLTLEVREGEGTRRLDPGALFPCDWDEGPGYLRDDFLRDPAAVGPFAREACHRVGAGPGARLTLVLQRWPRIPGQVAQPVRDARTYPLWTVACGDPAAVPAPLEGLGAVRGERQGRRAREGGAR